MYKKSLLTPGRLIISFDKFLKMHLPFQKHAPVDSPCGRHKTRALREAGTVGQSVRNPGTFKGVPIASQLSIKGNLTKPNILKTYWSTHLPWVHFIYVNYTTMRLVGNQCMCVKSVAQAWYSGSHELPGSWQELGWALSEWEQQMMFSHMMLRGYWGRSIS